MTRWVQEGSKQGAIAKVSRRSQLIQWDLRMDLPLIGRNGLRIKEFRKNRHQKQQKQLRTWGRLGKNQGPSWSA